jgi:hypothetical protein
MKLMRFGILLGFFVCLAATQVQADVIIYATPPNSGNYFETPAGTIGTEFTVGATAVTIGSLGVFDFTLNGFTDSHDVGLWTAGGTLIASATVPAGTVAPLYAGTRWALIPWVTLAANTSYIVGAQYPSGSDHFFSTAVIDPHFTLVRDLYIDAASLTVPDQSYFNNPNLGFFAANLSSVPEPAVMLSTLVMLLVAVGVFLHYRRKALAGV